MGSQRYLPCVRAKAFIITFIMGQIPPSRELFCLPLVFFLLQKEISQLWLNGKSVQCASFSDVQAISSCNTKGTLGAAFEDVKKNKHRHTHKNPTNQSKKQRNKPDNNKKKPTPQNTHKKTQNGPIQWHQISQSSVSFAHRQTCYSSIFAKRRGCPELGRSCLWALVQQESFSPCLFSEGRGDPTHIWHKGCLPSCSSLNWCWRAARKPL